MLNARPVGLLTDVDRGIIATKTPGRVLAKTRNVLQENAAHNAPMSVIAKGRKVVQNTPLQSRILYTDRALKDPASKQIGPSKPKDAATVRPLGDKTPFPNRTANQIPPTGARISKPALSDASLRPSSARKHDRLPRSASKAFETPITDGKHWDVSDIEIQIDAPVANQSIEEENYDEIEYMPPKIEDIPYEPPFEMPNYREVGQTLMALIRSYTLEEDRPSTGLTFTIDASESNFFTQPTLPKEDIKDDGPFARTKLEPEAKPPPPPTIKLRSAGSGKSTPRPIAQRTTPGTRTVTPANSQATSNIRRRATVSSTRPPTTAVRIPSQPVTRPSTSQSTLRAPISRVTTRAPSVARSVPPVRPASAQPSRTTTVPRTALKPAARSAVPAATAKGKPSTMQPSVSSTARKPVLSSSTLPNTGRPRSGTITKEEFESNTHVAIHIRNNSLEEVKKDLEGLIVFEDAFDDDDGFRFDV